MNSMISFLLGILYSSLSETTDTRIALEILKNQKNLQRMTLKELSEKCDVSVATLNKFFKQLGCRNMAEFKLHIVRGQNIRREQIRLRMEKMDDKTILDNISHLAPQPFNRPLFIKSCEEFNELAHESNQIIILGANYSSALSLHYQQDMNMFGKLTYSLSTTFGIVVPEPDPKTMIVLVTQSGNTLNFARDQIADLKAKHRRISIITGNTGIFKDQSIQNVIRMPITGEDEAGNAILIEIYRYLKYEYYKTYCEE